MLRNLKLVKGGFIIHQRQLKEINGSGSIKKQEHFEHKIHEKQCDGEGLHKKKHTKSIKPLSYRF